MGLQSLWSLGLACLDVYALTVKRDLNNALLVSLFVIGDWVMIKLCNSITYHLTCCLGFFFCLIQNFLDQLH